MTITLNGTTGITTTGLTSTGIDDNATSNAITIDSSENVGIGTTTPVSLGAGYKNLDIRHTTGGGVTLGDTSNIHAYLFSDNNGVTLQSPGSRSIKFTTVSTERMRIDSSGNVGIGTTNPLQLLHISKASADNYIRLGSNGANDAGIYFNTGTDWTIGTDTSNSNAFDLSNSSSVGGASKVVVTTGGNVGIGTTSPSTKLHLSGGDPSIRLTPSSTNDARIDFTDNTGTVRWYTGFDESSGNYVVAADESGFASSNIVVVDDNGNVGIGTTSPGSYYATELVIDCADEGGITLVGGTTEGQYLMFADGTSGNSQYRGFISYDHNIDDFTVNSRGTVRFQSGSLANEAMRIDSSGNLLVNRTTQVVGGKISVDYQNGVDAGIALKDTQTTGTGVPMQIVNGSGSVVGSITHDQSNTSFNTSSDERLKENIVDAPSGSIDGIRVRSFDWKASGVHQTYGMIAQELVGVAPEAVTKETAGNDMWSIDYSKLVPMMIKEIQDLKAEVAALKGSA